MTSVSATTIAAVAVPVAGAVATVGILAYQNRREISRMKDWAWGPERSTDEGHEGEVDGLSNQIDRIETKIDEEREQRDVDHEAVETEIKKNRYLVHASVRGLLEAVNDEVDEAELEVEDVEPDWISDELDDVEGLDLFGGRPPRTSDD